MSKLPNFWQFFNLTSQPVIPALYWDSYSYEERIKKICDKIWAILNYLKLVMELLNEFDDRLTVLEELYNALEERVTELERIVANHETRISEIERILEELDLDELLAKLNALLSDLASEYDPEVTYNTGDYVLVNDLLYRCNSDNVTGNFDENYWTRTDVGTELKSIKTNITSIFADLDNIYDIIAAPYDATAVYDEDEYCIHDGNLFRCTTAITTAEAWNSDHWTVTTVGAELERIASQSGGDDYKNIKFPSNNGSAPAILQAFKPLMFKTVQVNAGEDNPDNTNPYVIGQSGMAIKAISEEFTGTGYLAPQGVSTPTLLYGSGQESINAGGKYYVISFMLCDGNGNTIAYTFETVSGKCFVWSHNITDGWNVHIDDFKSAADEVTAATQSSANPFRIFYVVETPNT